MDYKVIIADEDVEAIVVMEVFEMLQKLVIDKKNIDLKNPAPFVVEGQEAVLIGTTWGVSRPDVEDLQEVSEAFPDLTFHFIQAGKILNGNHFENLSNFSLSVYQKGQLLEVMKPEPIVWKSKHVVEFLPSPWTS
jgi:hypothetical protein